MSENVSWNQARINRAAFASFAAMSLAACGEAPTRREEFMRQCIDWRNPVDCADAAERIWPSPPEPRTPNESTPHHG